MSKIEDFETLLADLAALRIEAAAPSFDAAAGRERFSNIQHKAKLLAPENRRHLFATLGQWPAYEPPPVKFSITLSSTGIPSGADNQRYMLREWCGKLDEAIRQTINDLPNTPHRPRGSGLQKADEPLIAEMRRLIESGDRNSAWAAAIKVVGDGSNIRGSGGPESKARRLTDRYKDVYGE